MNKLHFALVVVTISLFSANSFSYQYPVVTSIRTEIIDYRSADYHIQWGVLDSNVDKNVAFEYRVGPTHKHYFPGFIEYRIYIDGDDVMCGDVNGCSFSELAMKRYGMGLPSVVHHVGTSIQNECVGIAMAPKSGVTFSLEYFTPFGCLSVPPANNWCSMTSPELIINHGQLVLSDSVQTNEKTENLEIKCTAPMNIELNFNSAILELGKGLTSNLSFPKGNSVTVESGDLDILWPIKSSLTITPSADTGEFSASTIVYITYL